MVNYEVWLEKQRSLGPSVLQHAHQEQVTQGRKRITTLEKLKWIKPIEVQDHQNRIQGGGNFELCS
eukprot:747329-Hanusia_phi.AAC.1